MEKGVNYIRRYRRRWRRMLAVEAGLVLVAGAVIGYTVFPWGWGLTLMVTTALLSGWFWWRGPRDISLHEAADYLNRQHPDLQDSTELVLIPADDRSLFQRLQIAKILPLLEQYGAKSKVPNQLRKVIPVLLILVALLVLIQFFVPRAGQSEDPRMGQSNNIAVMSMPDSTLPAEVERFGLSILPPAYMRLATTQQNGLPIAAWEGSRARWNVSFSGPIAKAALLWGQGDTLWLTKQEEAYAAARILNGNTFYALAWQQADGTWDRSEYAGVEVWQDEAPEVRVEGREPYEKLDYTSGMVVEVALAYTDDFDITQSRIVATVARGSGESVRFREAELPIPHNWAAVRSEESVTVSLVLDSLEMTPGDELYFYVEAYDNRQPKPQRGRTEMYFIALRDTANEVIQMEGGLGVDLMPDYFRSQRQLIIDTEKLMADRRYGRVTDEEFKHLSNELGYDQKALRVKYGALLGLEDEDAGGVPAEFAPDANVEAYFQHEEDDEFRDDSHEHEEHDDDHEEAGGSVFSRLVAEGFGESHDHDHGEEMGENVDPLTAYMHAHDDSEEATFYAEGLKAKLRYALNEMWDAELHLRLYEPEKSLPFQYEALEMINDIRLDARIYVERVGFEPPPLKLAEVRLTGDQDEISPERVRRTLAKDTQYPALQTALPVLERLRFQGTPLSPQEQSLLGEAGQSLAAIALDQPGDLLVALSLLRDLEEETLSGVERATAAQVVAATLFTLLPPGQAEVTGKTWTLTPLQTRWLEAAEKGPRP